MHGDGSAKVSRKDFFLVKLAISATRNLGQHPSAVYSSVSIWTEIRQFAGPLGRGLR